MKCQNCGKREAIVDYTEVIDGNKLHLHLCDKCASEMKIGMNFTFDMDDMFSSFFNVFPSMHVASTLETIKCKQCGSTYDDFKNTGKLGCPECYETFESELDNVLKRLHGNNRHVKSERKFEFKDKKEKQQDELTKLKEELKLCVEKEEYEQAAKLRDEIRKIENKRGETK